MIAPGYSTRMARGMVPACRDNRPRPSTEDHRKTTPDRLRGCLREDQSTVDPLHGAIAMAL
jgi:hypothetical protein